MFAALLWDNMDRRSTIRKQIIKKNPTNNARAKELHFEREGKSNQTVSSITLIFHKYWTVFD